MPVHVSPGHCGRIARRAGAVLTAVSSAAVLARMRRDSELRGRLSPTTVTWMYATYGAHAATSLAALARANPPRHGRSERLVTGLGYAVAAGGGGLTAAGMTGVPGVAPLSGLSDDRLTTSGVYTWTRNPQYIGGVTTLFGLALARRSGTAALLALGAAGTFGWWVPVEERHLQATYGEPYRDYLARTPRWLAVRGGPSRIVGSAKTPPRPGTRIVRALARSPIRLFTAGHGWLFGERILMLQHTGRKSGLARFVVLEVVRRPGAGCYVVAAGYGHAADWYRNVLRDPVVRVWVGRRRGALGTARPLDPHEARAHLTVYRAEHPMVWRLLRSIISHLIGRPGQTDDDLFATVPLVELTVRS